MHRYTLFIFLLTLAGCFNGSKDGSRLIPLKDVVSSPIPDFYQSPSKVIRRRDFIRAEDKVSEDFLNQVVRNRASRPAANIVLNGDSLQISISTIGVYGQQRPGSLDQIYLNAWGDTLSPQAVDEGTGNFGIVGRQTILKVNRRIYLLNMLNQSRSHIRISELENSRDLPITASINTRYKKMSVLDPEDEPANIAQQAGKRLIIFFIRFPEGSEELLAVQKAFTKLPLAVQSGIQVAVVNRHTGAPAALKAFFRKNEIDFPLYFEGPGTCANLPCHDRFPYFLEVNSVGRITEYYGWLEELGW